MIYKKENSQIVKIYILRKYKFTYCGYFVKSDRLFFTNDGLSPRDLERIARYLIDRF